MPMLPSGRHVAILLEPLWQLLEEATNVLHVHKVLGIQKRKDLHQFIEVLWLVPELEATNEQLGNAFLDQSLPKPPGLVTVRSGYRLSQFEEYAAQWSTEDRKAFWDFILVRAEFLFEQAMAKTIAVQEILRTQAEGTTKLMVLWWDAGVHPAQEGYQVGEDELPIWDTYDMLAALGKMTVCLGMIDPDGKILDDLIRLKAVLSQYSGAVPQLAGWPTLEQSPRFAAQLARDQKWLDVFDGAQRLLLHRQCVYECVMLWDHLGENLQAVFPDCAKIIDLVVVSADANEVFNR